MVGRIGAPLALAFAALTLAVAAGMLLADEADAQYITNIAVTVKPSQVQQNASITDLTSANLTFDLTVTFTTPLPRPAVTVKPVARFEAGATGWDAWFNPTEYRFNGTGSTEFVAGVFVPANLSAGLTVHITFDATTEDVVIYNTQPATAFVSILPYYKIGRSYSTGALHVSQGGSRTFNFTITNRGNSDDTILITLEEEAALQAQGVTFLYERQKPLKSWETGMVSFIVTVEPKAIPTTVTFTFSLTSRGGGDAVSTTIPYSLVIDEAPLVSFLNDYWWAVLGLAVILIVVSFVMLRRRRLRREDAEAMALLEEYKGVEGIMKPPRSLKGEEGEGDEPEDSEGGDDGDGDEEAPQDDEGSEGEGPDDGTDEDDTDGEAIEVEVSKR
jgi:hypothetical protein